MDSRIDFPRLLIDQRRLVESLTMDNRVLLNHQEKHYLRRVLRLKKDDFILVVDGLGHLWKASLHEFNSIQLTSTFEDPFIEQPRPQTLVCLAVVLPKRGFEDVLRMGCEIGVDIFQPLTSEYRVHKGNMEAKHSRWISILKEAVEQSERLWMPELRKNIAFEHWLKSYSLDAATAFATTRQKKSTEFITWMKSLKQGIGEISIAIGPEGGWSNSELQLAMEAGCKGVEFGENIMRTSTAAISAAQLIATERRIRDSS